MNTDTGVSSNDFTTGLLWVTSLRCRIRGFVNDWGFHRGDNRYSDPANCTS